MRRQAIVVMGLLFLAWAAFAGDIYGSLREGATPKANTGYQVFDATNHPVSARLQTASNGSFHLSLPPGRFRLMVYLPGNPSADIVSSNNAVQYDFELIRRPDGTYALARR
jgi:hypothetical protein